jgi:hypothetical protein
LNNLPDRLVAALIWWFDARAPSHPMWLMTLP